MDLGKPFERITMVDAVKKYAGVDFNEIHTLKEAREVAKEHHVAVSYTHLRKTCICIKQRCKPGML